MKKSPLVLPKSMRSKREPSKADKKKVEESIRGEVSNIADDFERTLKGTVDRLVDCGIARPEAKRALYQACRKYLLGVSR